MKGSSSSIQVSLVLASHIWSPVMLPYRSDPVIHEGKNATCNIFKALTKGFFFSFADQPS